MTEISLPRAQNFLQFACPHCATVLAVSMDRCDVAGPCPKCWQSILPPALDEHGQPISEAPAKPAPAPFQPKLVIPSIVMTEDKSREREVRARVQHTRRMKSIYNRCDAILNSRMLRVGKIILCITLMSVLGFTYRYMKKHRWSAWWKTSESVVTPAAAPVVTPAATPATPVP